MCENNCQESMNVCQDVKVTTVTLDDAQQAYINSLLEDIKKLQFDLETEKRNCNRFNQLYTCLLGYTMKCLNEKDITVFDEAVKKLAEIEVKA